MNIEIARGIVGEWNDFNRRYLGIDCISLTERSIFTASGYIDAWTAQQKEIADIKEVISNIRDVAFNGDGLSGKSLGQDIAEMCDKVLRR